MKARRRRLSVATRIKPFWMPIALSAAAVLTGLIVVATWTGFDPQRVGVSGNQRVSSGEILARAAVVPHESIWLQNTGAMVRRIAAIPYIANASISRIPPASIAIVVSERVPFAVLRSGGDSVVVDRSLRVLAPADDDKPYPSFVVKPGLELVPGAFVTSPEAVALRAAYDAMSARQMAPIELAFDRFGGLVVTMPGKLRLLLGGEADMDRKLGLAQAILAQVVRGQRRVAAIDLRAPSTPVLVYR